ncbi:MAG: FtsH protease activity modulator HflK [Pseudomonadales bacterium]|nr:FtsH protease activity modulator HflK [Gammaproteobacteria bacterium]
MAWNEPGNNGRDPWGGGNRNDQGPPDLDEVMKKLQDGLNGLFGKKKSGGSDNGSQGGGFHLSPVALGVLGLILVVGYAALGFYKVDEQERAVVLRFGQFLETKAPGLRWNAPMIDEVNKVNVTRVRTHSSQAVMLTEDENIVDVTLAVQYVVSDPKAYLLNVREPDISLTHATDSAIRHVVGSAEMGGVISEGREALGADVQTRLQTYLENYETGLRVVKVNIENSQPPRQVQAAFDDVIKAREDEQRLKNQAEAYANGIIPEARGRAQRVLEEANAYREQVVARAQGEADRFLKLLAEYKKAPEVTRQRLYIDAVQEVMQRSSKVMVDVNSGSNIMYLPLDRIAGQVAPSLASAARSTPSVTGSGGLNPSDIRSLTDQVLEELRSRQGGVETRSSGGIR